MSIRVMLLVCLGATCLPSATVEAQDSWRPSFEPLTRLWPFQKEEEPATDVPAPQPAPVIGVPGYRHEPLVVEEESKPWLLRPLEGGWATLDPLHLFHDDPNQPAEAPARPSPQRTEERTAFNLLKPNSWFSSEEEPPPGPQTIQQWQSQPLPRY